jgi:hypothetical protein
VKFYSVYEIGFEVIAKNCISQLKKIPKLTEIVMQVNMNVDSNQDSNYDFFPNELLPVLKVHGQHLTRVGVI